MTTGGAKISRFGEYRGYASADYDGWRRFSQHVTVRDGTRIAIDYYRPTRSGALHTERLPVVWSFNRYQRSNITGGELYTTFHQHPPLLDVMQHGYVFGNADVRGSGASFGSKHGWFPPEEAEDAFDLTEWFGAQPWCNGRIGMARRSYLGITQYFNASQSPPHLGCLFPGVAFIDEYDFIYPGGIFLDWPVYSWAGFVEAADRSAALPPDWRDVVERNATGHAAPVPYVPIEYGGAAPSGGDPAGPVAPVDEDHDGRLLAEATAAHRVSMNGHTIGAALPFRDSVDARTGARYHEQRSPWPRLPDIARSGVPAYHLGGWFDGFTRDTMLWFRNYPNRQKLIMGPWFHGGLEGIDMPAEYLRWFDHWLKGVDNGVLEEPVLHYWTLNASEGEEWRGTDAWPLPSECRAEFHFHAGPSGSIDSANDGLLVEGGPGSEGRDDYRVDYTASSGIDNRWTWTAGGGTVTEVPKPLGVFPYPDMRGNDAKGLTYTTAPLDRPLEVTGHPVVHLWVTSSAKDGDFFVYLEDVQADGRSVYVTEGQLRASHRRLAPAPYDRMGLPYHRSYAEDAMPLVPGEAAELCFDLQPTSVVFRTEHRIRVTVTCADKDTFATPILDPAPEVSVLRGGARASRIVLPVIPQSQS